MPVLSHSVVSDSLQTQELQSARLLYPPNFPGKNTGVGCHLLLQGIFPTQGLNLGLLWLLQCRQILYHLSHQGCSWWGQINKTLTEDLQRRFPLTPAPAGSALLAVLVRALSWVLVPGEGQCIG